MPSFPSISGILGLAESTSSQCHFGCLFGLCIAMTPRCATDCSAAWTHFAPERRATTNPTRGRIANRGMRWMGRGTSAFRAGANAVDGLLECQNSHECFVSG